MPVLHVALQEGFNSEPVSVTVDGREIYRKDQVRTRTQIGHADHVETTHVAGPATIVVNARGASATIALTLDKDTFVGVSIARDGRITHQISQEAFRYM